MKADCDATNVSLELSSARALQLGNRYEKIFQTLVVIAKSFNTAVFFLILWKKCTLGKKFTVLCVELKLVQLTVLSTFYIFLAIV